MGVASAFFAAPQLDSQPLTSCLPSPWLLGVPSHAICVSSLTLITTEVLGRNQDFDWV